MSGAEVEQTLQDLAAAYEKRGPAALEGLGGCPVLVHCTESAPASALNYQTSTASWDLRVELAMAKRGLSGDSAFVVRGGPVSVVVKRAGRPFPDRIGVGRARTADISIRHSSISKYHAYITHDERGRWLIWDAASRNGTRVGDQKVEPGQGVELTSGAVVWLGGEASVFFTASGLRELLEAMVS